MATRLFPPASDTDLAAFSRDLKRLIDQAQRIRDQINQRLSARSPAETFAPRGGNGRRGGGRRTS